MLLKNPMEDKKLDFNQPLLSVRRVFSSVPVPESASQSKANVAVPKLPPLPVYKSDLKSGPVRNAGSVPFVWEQIPGRPKYESKAESQALDVPHVAPKLPPGRILNVSNDSDDTMSSNNSRAKNALSPSPDLQSLGELLNKEENSKEETERTSNDSEDGDEAYVDALDTLSRSESFFLNCSISGVSGLDDANLGRSRTLSTDPGTQNFMMDRFLPAAKAMASESPQYSVKKQPVVSWKQPRETRKIVSVQKKPPLPSYRSKNIPHFLKGSKVEESEEDDDDDVSVFDEPNKSSLGVCGLFPRLCLQMNSVPGLRKQVQVATTSVRTRRVNSTSALSSAATENKEFSHSATLGNASRPKSVYNFRELLANERIEFEPASGSPVVEKTLYIDSVHMVKPQISSSCSTDLKDTITCETDDVENLEQSKDILEIGYVKSLPEENKHLSVDEKKLRPKSQESVDTSFLSASGRSTTDVQVDVVESSVQVEKPLPVSVTLKSPKVQVDRKTDIVSKMDMESMLQKPRQFTQDSIPIATFKAVDGGKTGLDNELNSKSKNEEISGASYSLLPLPILLPKPPSESWLKRTLPAVSSKNSISKPSLSIHQNPKFQASRTQTNDPKWELLVKPSNLQHSHLRFSEELLAPIPEN